MRSVTLVALSLMFVGAWSHDSARGQTSVTPPVSLAPPDASPPRPGPTKPARVTTNRTPPAAPGREPSVIGGPQLKPDPAADYDGFSVGTVDDVDTPSRVTPPVRSRAARDARSNPDANDLDQEDSALKRKLMICRNCK
ncbi:hypothetical protein ACVIW2_002844 [Bradyrhizobium huanghuaihaiense]|uniref:Uncharacterized protein n=1 Tax=Bradyrhizobium huanghuaihaiense TaxID=990078 RepID=A0A562S2V8_9BRAD|nr:hypothetical protein [Bradyrhizobium huanghuaihaiense]TWI74920.1 hypothetical protein IQ16_01212 [Bradyrhizobium huanghuaihaiense]